MNFDKLLRIGFPALCATLTLFLGANAYSLYSAQSDYLHKVELERSVLNDALRFNTTALEKLIARYGAFKSPEDATEARKTYEILVNAFETWPSDAYSEIVGPSDYIQQKLLNIIRASNRVKPFLDTLDDQTSLNNALIILQGIESSLEQINRMATEEAGTQMAAARDSFHFQQILQDLLIVAFLLASLGWIWFTNKRSQMLQRQADTSREQMELLEHRLNHDSVTGLINYRVFAETVRATHETLAAGQTLAILNIDLESRLPAINKFSLATEEAILTSTADLLRHAVDRMEGENCLARSAGKGFLLMTISDEDLGLTASVIANRIHDIFLRPIPTAVGSFLISPAIGYADSTTVERDAADIIRNADLAVSNAVNYSRRRVVTYEPAMRAEMERRTIVENALARAIEANECLPHFQPQFNLMTGRIFGVEALARWYHSELGWISPSEFIPIAERNGDIVSLGWKILETSCSEVQLLPSDLSLSVNLSVAQILSDDVVAMLDECLGRTGLPASRLKLEVTETTLMSDLRRIQTTLSELRSLGIGISLDDFGVGYSALSYLTDFDWDEIKIDRSFATKAVKDKKLRDILKMVLGIAETMGSQVLIEGIETVEQRDVLVDIGCTIGQGYLFGGPMAIDDITTLFFSDHSRSTLAGL
ncbi:putative bifunctional diguanylate cyclase/phosphodiesterase [Roseibium aggregatum]|uniref:putative bifunctional diguanylate cyclase/phosphodiesterase n=1 Tax=Roseibium aggregatum TaxID=187304 RepID=UPI0018DBCBFE|nr:bifunctional diguanylate cyclase/phosphodiesterase [Roseibium aggregatum]